METITFLNEKGGVGKTTSAIVISSELARQGYKVCLIDGDSQGHATLALNLPKERGMYSFLGENAPAKDVLRAVDPQSYGAEEYNLWVIPGNAATRNLQQMMSENNGVTILTLKERIEKLANTFDFVIIDTSPSIGTLHISYYIASDWIIAPTECTYLPMEGLFASLEHLEEIRNQLEVGRNVPIAKLLGILPTKFYGREIVQYENLGYLKGKYEGMVLPYLRRLSDWEKASQVGELLYTFSPNGNAMKDARAFVDEVLNRIKVSANV
jgi:chromosome partitioning protein